MNRYSFVRNHLHAYRFAVRSFSTNQPGPSEGDYFNPSRPRRNRKTPVLRGFSEETWLANKHFVYPLFIHDSKETVPIASMPGQSRLGITDILKEVEGMLEDGVSSLVLFPSIREHLKTTDGAESFNERGLIPTAIREIKRMFPQVMVITDVALDPYNSDGHDGIVAKTGRLTGHILNDETVEVLCKQALCQAHAGADIIAPSDMMDGRVGAIRAYLDAHGFSDVAICAYTAKYASALYGPFREALDSAPKFGDKKTYQMQYTNVREAIRELHLDEEEGADMVMVKPAGMYLDVIRALKENTNIPVAAYQVSGEYAMIKAAAEKGWLNERSITLESLYSIRRAGASMIFTYYARQAARWLKEDGAK